MNIPTKILSTAALIGLLADLMLKDTFTSRVPIGLGLCVLIWAAAAAAIYLACASKLPRKLKSLGFLAPTILFSLGYVFRDSPTLLMIDLAVVFTGLAFTAASLSGLSLTAGGIGSYLSALMVSALAPALNTLDLLINQIHWPSMLPDNVRTTLTAMLKGLAIATPLMLIFFALFAAADPAFAALAANALKLDCKDALLHAVIFSTFTWMAAGYLHSLALKSDNTLETGALETSAMETSAMETSALQTGALATNAMKTGARTPKLGITEIATVLGLLNLLFASFVAVQVKYLFGGASLVNLTPGLTYADYVHKGFAELNTVVALVLPILLLADSMLVKTHRGEIIFRANAGMLIALVMLILASAMQRMNLYQTAFGQSELRLYVTVFMTWLGSVCAIFAATVLRGRRDRFAFSSYVSGLVILAAVNAANPDAMIEAANIKLARETGKFDVNYALALSNDAVPTLLTQLDSLPADCRKTIALRLLTQKKTAWKADWRAFNFSRMCAYQAVADRTRRLENIAGLEKQVTM